jgi:hypothetical protein
MDKLRTATKNNGAQLLLVIFFSLDLQPSGRLIPKSELSASAGVNYFRDSAAFIPPSKPRLGVQKADIVVLFCFCKLEGCSS